jgi:Tol biopolymer transport system component
MPQRRPSGPAPVVAPIIALMGLALLAGGSIWAASTLDFAPAEAAATPLVGEASGGIVIDATPTPIPTTIVTPPPELSALFPGTILFTRAGNIVAASSEAGGLDLHNVTRQRTDSWPTWSANGERIIYVRTTQRVAYPTGREDSKYTFYPTDIMSINANGRQRRRLFESQFQSSQGPWFTTAVQPDLSPNGRTIALVSDGRTRPSSQSDIQSVVLSTMNANGNNLQFVDVRDSSRLGHNDPEWSPEGKRIAFTYASNSGARVGILTMASDRVNRSRRGYANPSWSPDGRLLVCERTTEAGRDIVVLDPRTWAEVARLTNDEDSFAPTWSPNGDQIAYLHRDGMKVDLRVITLDVSSGALTLVDDKAITADGHVDPESTPAWFIPEAELIQPTPAPEPSNTAPESTAP